MVVDNGKPGNNKAQTEKAFRVKSALREAERLLSLVDWGCVKIIVNDHVPVGVGFEKTEHLSWDGGEMKIKGKIIIIEKPIGKF